VNSVPARHHVGHGGHAHEASAQLVDRLKLHAHLPRGAEVGQLKMGGEIKIVLK
jgi:hypothetical protein